MSAHDIYLFALIGAIRVGSAIWVYRDANRRGQSPYWALGTVLMPEAFFPIYFWRNEPRLIWHCPACASENTNASRKCRNCDRLYTSEETVLRLHGNPEPSDVMVISLAVFLVHRTGLYIALLIKEGPTLLSNEFDVTTLSSPQLCTIDLIAANALVWLCFHCISVRCRVGLDAIGLKFSLSHRQLALPLVAAPLLFLFSEATTHSTLQISRWTSITTLENLVRWELSQEAAYLPKDLDATIILVAFVSIFLSPFAYEVLYRGIGYPAFVRRFGHFKGIALSALFYAVFHGGVVQFIPYFVFGVISALLFSHTRSLYPSIITHGLVNTFTLVALVYRAQA